MTMVRHAVRRWVVDENNTCSRNATTTTASARRSLLFLMGALGFVGVIATVRIVRPEPDASAVAASPLFRSVRSTTNGITKEKWSLNNIRDLAKDVGSTGMDWKRSQDDLCETHGCLESASRLLNSIDFSVDPCTDFYEFACGRWLAENQIPPTQSRWSQFNLLREQVNNITQDILSSEKDAEDPKPVNQVKDFYKGCIDVETLNRVGVKPIRDELQKEKHGDWPMLIGSAWKPESFNWLTAIGDLRRTYLDTAVISVYVDQDMKDSDHYAIYLDQPTLTLPRDMLINKDGTYETILEAYLDFVMGAVQLLAEAGGDDPMPEEVAAEAEDLIAFETALAKITTKDELRTDSERMYNPYRLPDFQKITDEYGELTEHLGVSLNWLEFLKTVFKTSNVQLPDDTRVVVLEQGYFRDLVPLLLATPPRTVANYLTFRYVSGLSGETTQELRDIAFKFNQATTGAKEPPKRQKSCADAANAGFGMAIGVKYIVAANFDESAKSEVNAMVADLRIAFKQLLDEATWMDDTTRAKAHVKIDKMRSFMAYPDWLKNKTAVEYYYLNLEIDPSSHFKSVQDISQWNGDKALKKFGTLVDRNEWLTYPGVVNAFYSPTYNSITFLAGILQTPFFLHGAPASLNYGGIGVVIGHEITHGFDNTGRQYDADGNAIPWWSNDTLAKYNNKTSCISDQYSAYKPPEVELKVNGELTLGENIADNSGLRESLLAYRHYVKTNGTEKRLPGLEKYDAEQLFYLGYATVWCEKTTTQGLTNQLLTDPHSPGRFRVQGPLSNNGDFANTWNCPVGSVMNPGPQHRCVVW